MYDSRLAARRSKLVGGMCSVCGTVICKKYIYIILIFFLLLLSIPFFFFFYTFLILVLINRRNVPRYQRVLALCAFFFNRSDTERTNSSKILCSMFVYFVLCKFVYRTDFVVFE